VALVPSKIRRRHIPEEGKGWQAGGTTKGKDEKERSLSFKKEATCWYGRFRFKGEAVIS